jgi:threonine dehydrogenase-like Zn-dependent dehydrogenase
MRALVVPRHGSLELRELPRPAMGPFEALVRIKGCGICSTTDAELIAGRQPFHSQYPALLGHEAVGEVIEIGSKVQTFHVGDHVTRPVAIWPGETREGLASAWGGFAEYGIVRDRLAMCREGDDSLEHDYTALRQNVVSAQLGLPEAILAISLSETSSWFRHLPSVAGKSVCIAGTGIAGLSMALWSFMAGAKRIIVLGRRKQRLELARKIGASEALNVTEGPVPPRVRDLNGGKGVDFFLEAVGLPDQIELGLSCLAPGGTIAIYGSPVGLRYELSWGAGPGWANIAQYPAEEHLAYPWVSRLLERGLVPTAELMTHHWKLDHYQEAFEAVADGSVVKGWLEL